MEMLRLLPRPEKLRLDVGIVGTYMDALLPVMLIVTLVSLIIAAVIQPRVSPVRHIFILLSMVSTMMGIYSFLVGRDISAAIYWVGAGVFYIASKE